MRVEDEYMIADTLVHDGSLVQRLAAHPFLRGIQPFVRAGDPRESFLGGIRGEMI